MLFQESSDTSFSSSSSDPMDNCVMPIIQTIRMTLWSERRWVAWGRPDQRERTRQWNYYVHARYLPYSAVLPLIGIKLFLQVDSNVDGNLWNWFIPTCGLLWGWIGLLQLSLILFCLWARSFDTCLRYVLLYIGHEHSFFFRVIVCLFNAPCKSNF